VVIIEWLGRKIPWKIEEARLLKYLRRELPEWKYDKVYCRPKVVRGFIPSWAGCVGGGAGSIPEGWMANRLSLPFAGDICVCLDASN
jgi:hypothetical protein